jgi:hypothetical protein
MKDRTAFNNPSIEFIPVGIGGVLYPPNSLHPEVFNSDAIYKTCINGDDLWLKIMAIKNGTPTTLATSKGDRVKHIDIKQETGLWKSNTLKGGNDKQLSDILREYNDSLDGIRTVVDEISGYDNNYFTKSRPKVSIILTIDDSMKTNDLEKLSDYSIDNNIEIVVITNDNEIESLHSLSLLSNKNPRLVIISLKTDNRYEMRNMGLRVSRGKYIIFSNKPQYDLFDELISNVGMEVPYIAREKKVPINPIPILFLNNRYIESPVNYDFFYPENGIYPRSLLISNVVYFSAFEPLADAVFSNTIQHLAIRDGENHHNQKTNYNRTEHRQDNGTIVMSLERFAKDSGRSRNMIEILEILNKNSDDSTREIIKTIESQIFVNCDSSPSGNILAPRVGKYEFQSTESDIDLVNRACPICHKGCITFAPFGTTKRENATCSECGALERHRAFWLYLKHYAGLFSNENEKILHIDTESCIIEGLKKNKFIQNIVDLNIVSIKNFEDKSFDLIVCLHTLQKVRNDVEFLSEIHRVLRPGKSLIITVPMSQKHWKTIERVKPKKNRIYGKDFVSRLRESGFHARQRSVIDLFSNEQIEWYGLDKKGIIFVCTK